MIPSFVFFLLLSVPILSSRLLRRSEVCRFGASSALLFFLYFSFYFLLQQFFFLLGRQAPLSSEWLFVALAKLPELEKQPYNLKIGGILDQLRMLLTIQQLRKNNDVNNETKISLGNGTDESNLETDPEKLDLGDSWTSDLETEVKICLQKPTE